MEAHENKNFHERTKKICENWVDNQELWYGTLNREASAFPQNLKELPRGYNSDLYEVVSDCLKFHHEERPNLEDLKKTIDNNLAKLDRMYGEEIRKSENSIMDDFKLEYKKEERDEWALFSVGGKFPPPRKRRRVEIPGALEARLLELANDWNSGTRISTWSAADYGELDIIDIMIESSDRNNIPEFRDHRPNRLAWRYLFSCVSKRMSPKSDVYDSAGFTREEVQESLKHETKRTVLTMFRDTALRIAIETDKDAAEEADQEIIEDTVEDSAERISLKTLRHAVD
jgi:hypothetical protein